MLFHLSLLLLASLSWGSIVKPGGGDTFELLILHNNDMHARFEQTSQLSGACSPADRDAGKCYGGFPRVAHVVKEARKAAASGEGPPVLYLNAGDTYTGTAWFTIYKWKVAAEFLNALQPDAVSLGNHEFDNGVSGLTPFIRNLSCPVLAANLILTKEPDLEFEANLMKSVVFNVNGVKVAVIGYLTPDTRFLAVRNNVEYIDEVPAIREEMQKLKDTGINIFIALGHSGFLMDMKIAREVEGIDLVIGGHTNTFLWNGTVPDSETPQGPYPTYVKQKASERRVPVVQAYAYTKYLGKLHILFDSNGEIIELDGNPILLDNSIVQDPEVLTIIDKYRSGIDAISQEIVGSASVVLDGSKCRLRECNLGNFISDAIVHKYASLYDGKGWTDTPIAIIQGGAIRASIAHSSDRFNITKGDLFTVMPFDEYVVKASINGSTIWKMFEHAVEEYNFIRAPGQFLQISGMKVVYNFRKKPGQRVEKVEILCSDCQVPTYMPLNKTENYNILMNSFLSLGGDGFEMFNDLSTTIMPFSELSATADYLRQISPVFPAIEGRITINHLDSISSSSSKSLTMLPLWLTIAIISKSLFV